MNFDHSNCLDCEKISLSYVNTVDPYNATEYSHYLTLMMDAIRLDDLKKAKLVLSQHKERTQYLGGGPDFQWDMINDTTQNFSPFHMTIHLGRERIYLWLLSQGGDVSSLTYDGNSCLTIAVLSKSTTMVRYLIGQCKLNVNHMSKQGTALHIAAQMDCTEIVEILLTHPNIQTEIVDDERLTPLQRAGRKVSTILQRDLNQEEEKSMRSFSGQSYIKNRPIRPPIHYGFVYKVNITKLFIYQRFIVVDPELGILTRYLTKNDYPNNAKEIIPLENIFELNQSMGKWFQKDTLYYLLINYGKTIYLVFKTIQCLQKWMKIIKQSIAYTRYSKQRLLNYIIRKDQKTANKVIIQQMMDQENKQIEILEDDVMTDVSFRLVDQNTQFNKEFELQSFGIKDVEFINIIGQGSFGKVFKVKFKLNNKIYALKQQNKASLRMQSQLKYALNELDMMKGFCSPFLITLHCAFQTQNNLYQLMDYYENGDLSVYMTRGQVFDEYTAKFYISEIILAIQYLHSKNIIYRDLKPQNIMIADDGHIKLIDFGLAKDLKDNEYTQSFCGSPAYLSPEVVNGDGASKATDVYSIGLLLYEMLFGYPPFYTTNVDELLNNIRYGRVNTDHFKNQLVQKILGKMLDQNPNNRPTLKQIKQDLFFAEIDWIKFQQKEVVPPKLIKQHESKSKNGYVDVLDDQDYVSKDRPNYIHGWDFL
ncbi:hypothetical protein pb186bvf_007540 [Paramecium bursaria]